METRTIKLREVCRRNGTSLPYTLGEYQRTFEWATETGPNSRPLEWRAEVRDLWEDFHDYVYHRGRSHFCGVLLLDPASGKEIQIVDGQQRITCVFLLVLAIRDHVHECLKHAENRLPADFRWLIDTDFSAHLRLREEPAHAVHDQSAFDALAKRDISQSSIFQEHPVHKAYRFFHQQIADRFGTSLDSLWAFLNSVEERVTFLEINLSKEDDAKRMFERLNARGRQVTPTLLLENLVKFQDQSRNDEIARDAVQFLADLQASLSERDLMRFLSLLPRRLAIETALDADYARFRKYRDEAEQVNELKQWLAQMKVCRTLFEEVIDDGANHSLLHPFHFFATSSLLPTVIRVAEVFGKSSPEIRALECLTIRLSFYHTRPNSAFAGVSRRICTALQKTGVPGESDRAVYFEILRGADVSDTDFKSRFAAKALYGNGEKRRQCRHILERLENKLNQQVPGTISFRFGCSIEHVYPQRPGPEWGADDGMVAGPVKPWLHTIGNLTVLLIPDNSRISNRSYALKRTFFLDPARAIAENPDLEITAVPGNLQLNQTFSTIETWDVAAIQRRGALLAETACSIWPGIASQHGFSHSPKE